MHRALRQAVFFACAALVGCEGGAPPGASDSDSAPVSATTAPASSAATLAVCAPGVPGQAGDLRSLLRDAHITAQGSEGFRAPGGTDQVGFERAVSALLRSPTDAAPVADLEALGFAVLCFEHQGGSAWYVLQDRDPNRGGGTFAFNLAPARKLIVEAPHADSDLGTLSQAVDAGVSLGARAVLLNGASRCATATLTTCNGTSGPCGALRISDAAHDPDAFFTSAHRALRDAFPDELAVSLHGMSPQFGEAAVVSDGTANDRAGSISRALRDALNRQLPASARAYSCNDAADDGRYRKLCATSNVQGRLDNRAPDACTSQAASASDTFVHVEQGPELRGVDAGAARPEMVGAALGELVACALPGPGAGCPSPR